MRLAICLAVALCVLWPARAPAQKKDDKPTAGDEMIYKYLCAETDKLSQKFLDGAKTLDEWEKKRPRLYQQYMDMLGLWPIPEKTPLNAVVAAALDHEGVSIENLHFQSKPGLYVTANYYRPKFDGKMRKPVRRPTILYVCGHSNKGRDGNKSAYQDHGMWFASNGYNCLVVDSLQLGEIPAVHHGTYGRPWNHLKAYNPNAQVSDENRFWWHSAGYTPAGVEAWNGVRAIDYLLSRDDVDPERIGVTGISGGGAATFWIAAADDRVKVAVPVSGMSDLESYVKNKVVNGHCDCMFLYNTYQWDWTTIAALVAPRPLLFANSDNDSIFPMDGNRRIIEKLRTLYKMYGKPELVDDYVSVGGHAYRPDLRVACFKFLNKHLKGDANTPVKDAEFKPIEGKRLRVFPTDNSVPKDAINARVDETFVPRGKVELPGPNGFVQWKRKYMEGLAGVFRSLPKTIPPSGQLELAAGSHLKGGVEATVCFYFEDEDRQRIKDIDKFVKPFMEKEVSRLVLPPRFYRPYDILLPPDRCRRRTVCGLANLRRITSSAHMRFSATRLMKERSSS
jgi:dienelactone hydrolase